MPTIQNDPHDNTQELTSFKCHHMLNKKVISRTLAEPQHLHTIQRIVRVNQRSDCKHLPTFLIDLRWRPGELSSLHGAQIIERAKLY